MRTSKRHRKFKLDPIDDFDARYGYRRCRLPSLAVTLSEEVQNIGAHIWRAKCDFWTTDSQHVVVRFSCEGYVESFGAYTTSGIEILGHDVDFPYFTAFAYATLIEWIEEGIDDLPTSVYESTAQQAHKPAVARGAHG